MRNERGAWNFGLNAYWSRQTVCVEGGGGRGFHSKRGNQYSTVSTDWREIFFDISAYYLHPNRFNHHHNGEWKSHRFGSNASLPFPSFFFFRARELLTCTIRGHLSEPRLFFSFILHGEEWTSIEWIVTTRYPRDINGLRFGLYLFIIHLVTRILLF